MSYLKLLKERQKPNKMWSSPIELYPVHLSPTLPPSGQVQVIEPQVSIKTPEYLSVQPIGKPYTTTQEYSKRLWIC